MKGVEFVQDAGYTITHIAEEAVPLASGTSPTFWFSPMWVIAVAVIILVVLVFVLGYIHYRHHVEILDEEDNALKQMESVEGT